MSPLTWGICDRKMVSAGFQQGKLNEKEASRFLLVREKKTLRGKLSKKEKNTKNLPVRLEDQRDPCLVNKKKINLK